MTLNLYGRVSWFGGPDDMGVAPSENLAFIYDIYTAPYLFLATQPEGTSGLARRLNPSVPFLAVRWNYDVYPKTMLASGDYRALVLDRAPVARSARGRQIGDRSEETGRVADISSGLMEYLGIETDDEVEITFPYERELVV